MDRLAEIDEYNRAFRGALTDEDFLAADYTPEEIAAYRAAYMPERVPPQDIPGFGTLERVGEQFYAPSGGYADLYADSFLARNKDRTPVSVGFAQDYIDFVPFIGDVLGAGEVVQELQKDEPNYPLATALGAATVIGTIPAVGDPIARGVENAARYVLESPITADIVGGLRAIPDLDVDFLTGRGDPALAQGVGADVPKAPLTFDDVERAMGQTGRDIETIYAVDRPDIIKDMFRDDEFAATVLGELRANDPLADAASLEDLQNLRAELYNQTQARLADLPDEITVYRAGDLNVRDGISSFTLNPNYNPNLELPWNELRGSPELQAFTVKKSDILASPDLIRDFGEGEVIIPNSAVQTTTLQAATETVPAAPSLDDQIAELDVQVSALRQNVLDNPTDTAAFDEYKRVRQMRNDLKDQRAVARAEGRNVAPSVEETVRTPTSDEGFEAYLETVNPGGKRIAAEDRPNLMMGDMYGMLPRNSEVISTQDGVTFYRSQDGDYYATAFNPDVGEEDVVGYIADRGDGTELAVVGEMQGQGIGGELQYLFRKERPDAPTGGLTEAGERSLQRTYERLREEGIVDSTTSAPEAPATIESIRAFHGSPYDFDRFDLSFMGAGEGAQEYGKGLYFAEMQNVAEGYRDEIFAPVDPSAFSTDEARDIANTTLQSFGARPGALKAAVSDLRNSLRNEETTAKFFGGNEQRIADLNEAINYLENNVESGRLYEVNINADQAKMLDFDKPMSEQPQEVQDVLEPYFQMRVQQMNGDPEALRSKLQGGDIMMLEKTNREMAGEISKALSDAGIPGVRYLDQQSRSKQFEIKLSRKGQPYETEKIIARNQSEADRLKEEYKDKGFDVDVEDIRTRNFVVFDDSLIDIVKKHGFAGLMVGAAVQAGMSQGEDAEAA